MNRVNEPYHAISDEVLDATILALSKGEHWMAYNGSLYFIDVKDIYFFKEKQEAIDFVKNNISDHDHFTAIQIDSVDDVLRKVRYGDIFYEDTIQYSSLLNQTTMNTENTTYLKDNVKYMGFGENMHAELEQKIAEGKADFTMHYKAEINKKPFEATLSFRKSDSSDMYFFNRYEASLERKNGEKLNQTFYLNKGKGVTAKEAYNLLEGRAVYKELSNKAGEAYHAWIQLDFDKKDKNNNFEVNQYHENYGYDVKAAVSKFAVAELDGGEKEKALIQSLQKGNVQSVTIGKDGNPQKMFIEANPQYKTVKLYDGQMKLQQKEAVEQYRSVATTQTAGQSEKAVKEENAQKKSPEQKKDSLMPKKRTSKSKGMSV